MPSTPSIRPPRLEPFCVHGGFRMAKAWWERDTQSGWVQEHDFEFLPATIYPTADDCRAAIDELPVTTLTEALAEADGVEPLKGHRLKALRILNALLARGVSLAFAPGEAPAVVRARAA